MSDKLVFDLAQEVEGSPNVFVRKDWLNILDNQNQNYNNNQSIIDTSQLSNSNKYMSYREAYLLIPFLVTVATTSNPLTFGTGVTTADVWNPTAAASSADASVGLKNWFGQIIHSFTLDYNGTTIVQQTPYINMWNSFKLITSLSLDDINTQGATIGFYPDDPLSWQYVAPGASQITGAVAINMTTTTGQGVCNNTNLETFSVVAGRFTDFSAGEGNDGFLKRQNLINFDIDGVSGPAYVTYPGIVGTLPTGSTFNNLLVSNATSQIWKSYISAKQSQVIASTTPGLIQFSITATVYLKHIHSFFNMCPLLKGVFMKMTMNLNNTTTTFTAYSTTPAYNSTTVSPAALLCTAVSNPLGGVNPLMIASGATTNGGSTFFRSTIGAAATVGGGVYQPYKMNISVGAVCLDSTMGISSAQGGTLAKSVYLYIPAYTFNPVFEQAYLSSPIKQIKYSDVYQYQVLNISSGQPINNLITNGIANVKSVLVLPFYSTNGQSATSAISIPYNSTVAPASTALATGTSVNNNTGFLNGTPVWQSPFDPAGTGPTSPMCWLTNFNIQVSGQNAIYNTERYNFEQFNNQLYGQNSVNGGLTDGLTSGLVGRQDFDMEYCYYYVNVERMLPVEESVPKSVQIIGQNLSAKACDYWVFVEYGVKIDIDVLTGARV
jgi:hypothetical protein